MKRKKKLEPMYPRRSDSFLEEVKDCNFCFKNSICDHFDNFKTLSTSQKSE